MKSRIVALAPLLFLFVFATHAIGVDDSLTHPKNKHYVGAAAGFTTGYGMSYRYWPCRFGVQGTLGYFESNLNSLKRRTSIGASLLYKVVDAQSANLFLYQGNHYNKYHKRSGTNLIQDLSWTHGLGIGFEICRNNLSINLMGGYGVFEHFTVVSITGEVGLYFMF